MRQHSLSYSIAIANILFFIILYFTGCSILGLVLPLNPTESEEPKEAGTIESEPPIELNQTITNAADVPPPAWAFEKQAIIIRIQATQNLNWFQNQSHTLRLGVFQMADPNNFNNTCSTKEGLSQFLSKENFDEGTGVLTVDKRIIRAGETQIVTLDRAKTAQYIGVIAGYFELIPSKTCRIIEIPAIQDDETGIDRINPLSNAETPRPAKLKIWLNLDTHQIENLQLHAE